MAKDNKTTGAGTAEKKDTPPAPPAETARKRNAISPAKALAIQVAGLAAILNTPKVAAALTEPQKAQVAAANKAAEELNATTIKPVQDRIAAIAVELRGLMEKITEPGTAEKAKELSMELKRKQDKLAQLTSASA